jgi:hypothetical protein
VRERARYLPLDPQEEHIPPAGSLPAGFRRMTNEDGDDWLEGRKGRIYQSGYHAFVFCEPCNNDTRSGVPTITI